MYRVKAEKLQLITSKPRINGVRVGSIVEIQNRKVIVDFPGNSFGPQVARIAGSLDIDTVLHIAEKRMKVILVFENNDPSYPILLDFLNAEQEYLEGDNLKQDNDLIPSRKPISDILVQKEESTEKTQMKVRLTKIAFVKDGTVYVDLGDFSTEPKPAKTTIRLRNLRDEVVIQLLPNGEPIIIGQVYPHAVTEIEGNENFDVALKGKSITIEAEKEIVLISGRTKIKLDARGKITTLAEQVISRARGANKVQGGCVQIN